MKGATSAIRADLENVTKPVRDRVIAFRLLVSIGPQLRALMDLRLASSGITTQQAALLALASGAKSPLSQGQAATLLGVSHQNIRQIADALERKGLLQVRPDPEDGRGKRLVPTKTVPKLFARRNQADFLAVAKMFAGLRDREVKTLVALLERVLEGIASQRGGEVASRMRVRQQ